jgi:DNA-binding transcriptional MerR regulator
MQKAVTISDAACALGLSTRTLRHWEEVGLFTSLKEPSKSNEYRYYDGLIISHIQTIMALREVGLPLQEIQKILQFKDVNAETINDLRDKAHRIYKSIDILSALGTTRGESYVVSETLLPENYYVVYEKWVQDISEASEFYINSIIECINDNFAFSPTYSVFCQYPLNHPETGSFKREDFLMRFFVPISEKSTAASGLKKHDNWEAFISEDIRFFEGVEKSLVCIKEKKGVYVVYKGLPNETDAAYEALYKHIEQRGYKTVSKPHEIYLNVPEVFEENPNLITRIVVPVEK